MEYKVFKPLLYPADFKVYYCEYINRRRIMNKNLCKNCNKGCKVNFPYTLLHNYGSNYNGEVWEFCCLKCLLKYLNTCNWLNGL